MNILFLHSDKPREKALADAVIAGARNAGHSGTVRLLGTGTKQFAEADVVGFVGVKSLELHRMCLAHNKQILYFDKGYRRKKSSKTRVWIYWRVSVNAHNPVKFVTAGKSPIDRWEALGLHRAPWRERGKHIIFAGSSEKNHRFYGLPHPTKYATDVCAELSHYSDRKILYRPKPSWKGMVPIPGTALANGTGLLNRLLLNAHCLVTHNSASCYDALMAGVPAIVLGDGVAKPLFSHDIGSIEDPKIPDDAAVAQWLANLAYCQWRLEEYESGEAWATLSPQLGGQP